MFRHHRDPRSHHELPELSEEHVLAHFANPNSAGLGGAASQRSRSYRRTVGVAVTWLPSPRTIFTNFHVATARPARPISTRVTQIVDLPVGRKHPRSTWATAPGRLCVYKGIHIWQADPRASILDRAVAMLDDIASEITALYCSFVPPQALSWLSLFWIQGQCLPRRKRNRRSPRQPTSSTEYIPDSTNARASSSDYPCNGLP